MIKSFRHKGLEIFSAQLQQSIAIACPNTSPCSELSLAGCFALIAMNVMRHK